MEQTHIYNFLGINNDPIFNEILRLEKGRKVDLGGIFIVLNENGLYELETAYHHECFTTKKKLYDGLSRYLSLLVL